MPRRLLLCLAALLTMGSLPRQAAADDTQAQEAPTWYQVEIILFDQEAKGYIGSETWPTDISQVDPKDLVELSFPTKPSATSTTAGGGPTAAPPTTPLVANNAVSGADAAATTEPSAPKAFEMLPPDEERLNDLYKRLKNSKDYRPLIHVGWRQLGLPKEQSKAVHIFAGMENQPLADGEMGPPAPETISDNLPPALFTADGDQMLADRADEMIQPVPPLKFDGTVEVILSRYLHMDVDMRLRKLMIRQPAAADGNTNTNSPDSALQMLAGTSGNNSDESVQPVETFYQTFRMQESRRMRSNEVHYFDHPVFGMIAVISPWQPPQAPPAATPAADGTPATP